MIGVAQQCVRLEIATSKTAERVQTLRDNSNSSNMKSTQQQLAMSLSQCQQMSVVISGELHHHRGPHLANGLHYSINARIIACFRKLHLVQQHYIRLNRVRQHVVHSQLNCYTLQRCLCLDNTTCTLT